VPRESLDAPENLPKEAPRQVAFHELQGEVPEDFECPPAKPFCDRPSLRVRSSGSSSRIFTRRSRVMSGGVERFDPASPLVIHTVTT